MTRLPVITTEETLAGHRGHRLRATRWRPAGQDPLGPAVLLLHGGGQSRLSWSRAGAPLAAAGLEVWALDTRGHGDSEWAVDGDYSIETMAADLEAVVTALDRQVALVGASLGGILSLVAASHLPERIASLLLVDIVPRYDQAGGQRVKDFMESGVGGFDTLEEAASAVAHYLPHRSHGPSPDRLARRLRQRADGRWYWAWDPAFLRSRKRPVGQLEQVMLAALPALQDIPMMLLHGGASDVVRTEGIEVFLAQAPWLRVITVDEATHTAAGDDNDAFIAAALELLTDSLQERTPRASQ